MSCRVVARLRHAARARAHTAAPAVAENAPSPTAAARHGVPRVPLATFIVLAMTLAGCGQKGPLVLPDRAQATGQSASSDADREDDRRDDRRGETDDRDDER